MFWSEWDIVGCAWVTDRSETKVQCWCKNWMTKHCHTQMSNTYWKDRGSQHESRMGGDAWASSYNSTWFTEIGPLTLDCVWIKHMWRNSKLELKTSDSNTNKIKHIWLNNMLTQRILGATDTRLTNMQPLVKNNVKLKTPDSHMCLS